MRVPEQARFLVGHPGFKSHPVRSVARLATWRVHCWLGRAGSVTMQSSQTTMTVPPEWRGMSKLAYVFGDLAEPELPHVARFARPGSIAVDVGCHYGDYTLAMARAVGDQGKVVAVDPSEAFLSVCEQNIASNGFANVDFQCCGLGASPGTASIFVQDDPSRTFLLPPQPEEQSVPIETLDRMLRDRQGQVSFIKIDVEGMEEAVLRGARGILLSDGPTVLFEYQKHAAVRANRDPDAAWQLLRSLGYDLFTLSPDGNPSEVDRPLGDGNYLAIRPSVHSA